MSGDKPYPTKRSKPNRNRKRKDNTVNARKRKQRHLERAGIFEVKIQIAPEKRGVLVETGHLAEWDEDDKRAVQEAAQKLFDKLTAETVTA